MDRETVERSSWREKAWGRDGARFVRAGERRSQTGISHCVYGIRAEEGVLSCMTK